MLPPLVVEEEDRKMDAWTIALAIISGIILIPICIWSTRECWRTYKETKELRQLMIDKLEQEKYKHNDTNDEKLE